MEQFTIKPLIPLEYKGIDISFTNSALCMVIAVLASSLILGLCIRKRNIIPTAAQCIPESIYGFINNLIKENVVYWEIRNKDNLLLNPGLFIFNLNYFKQ